MTKTDRKMCRSRLRELLASVPVIAMMFVHFSLALTGEHVCYHVENYTVTSREQYVEPVEIHTLGWCLQIPPRCPQIRTELRERWRMKTEVKFKTVPTCCEGYVVQELIGSVGAETKCVPHCKKCRNGVCTAPNECTCESGFQGQDCAYECPHGSWGQSCSKECNCLQEVTCNPVTGKCACPPGWMGSRCESKCPKGQWGNGCNSICLCESPQAGCHHETGECVESDSNSLIDPFEASGISINLVLAPTTAKIANTDYFDVIDFDKEAILPKITEQAGGGPNLPEDMILVQQQDVPTTEGLSTRTIEEKPSGQRPTSPWPSESTSIEGNQLSQPDVSSKKSNFDFDDRHSNFRVIVSPKTEYVKTTNKGASMSGIPIDVAAMIVVGAIVSIGLTSAAALMIFHMRSRLLKTALSIYNQEKVERQFTEKDNACRKELDATTGTLPRTMTRVNPVYNGSSDMGTATLRFDDRQNEYANGTVTIGIRLSGNLRDLLESQYDRPASCSQRSTAAGDVEVEHVYDEIPFAPPFHFEKNT